MRKLLAIEHSRAAYRLDYVLYGSAVVLLAAVLIVAGPGGRRWEIVALAGAGVVGWTLIEYALHRFVLHGLPPFKEWHEQHHRRPTALICTPTILSAGLIAIFVYFPLLAVGHWWRACSLTLGFVAGYLVYAIVHHCIHHGSNRTHWLSYRRRWHGRHHDRTAIGRCYGVTTGFWDHLFGTTDVGAPPAIQPSVPITTSSIIKSSIGRDPRATPGGSEPCALRWRSPA